LDISVLQIAGTLGRDHRTCDLNSPALQPGRAGGKERTSPALLECRYWTRRQGQREWPSEKCIRGPRTRDVTVRGKRNSDPLWIRRISDLRSSEPLRRRHQESELLSSERFGWSQSWCWVGIWAARNRSIYRSPSGNGVRPDLFRPI